MSPAARSSCASDALSKSAVPALAAALPATGISSPRSGARRTAGLRIRIKLAGGASQGPGRSAPVHRDLRHFGGRLRAHHPGPVEFSVPQMYLQEPCQLLYRAHLSAVGRAGHCGVDGGLTARQDGQQEVPGDARSRNRSEPRRSALVAAPTALACHGRNRRSARPARGGPRYQWFLCRLQNTSARQWDTDPSRCDPSFRVLRVNAQTGNMDADLCRAAVVARPQHRGPGRRHARYAVTACGAVPAGPGVSRPAPDLAPPPGALAGASPRRQKRGRGA